MDMEMAMTEALTLVLMLLAGGALGAMFFGGLWWTVRRGMFARQPALWFLASFVVRTSVALAGFLLVAGGSWQRWVAYLVGFVAARPVVAQLTRRSAEGAGHGS